MEGQAIGFVGGVLAEPPAPWASLLGRLGRFWRLLVGPIVDDDIAGSERAGDGAGRRGPSSREIDGAVLRRAQRGDHGAFHEIVDHYEGRLRVLAYQLLRDADQMNDVLQDTFVKAWAGLPEFRGDAALGTWLYRICYRICLDHLRRQQVRPAGEELADDLADPTDDFDGLALREQVIAGARPPAGRAARRPPARRPRGLRLRDGGRGARGPGRHRRLAPLARPRRHAPALRPEPRARRRRHDGAPRRPARPAALRAPPGERGCTAAAAGLPRRARGPAPGHDRGRRPRHHHPGAPPARQASPPTRRRGRRRGGGRLRLRRPPGAARRRHRHRRRRPRRHDRRVRRRPDRAPAHRHDHAVAGDRVRCARSDRSHRRGGSSP